MLATCLALVAFASSGTPRSLTAQRPSGTTANPAQQPQFRSRVDLVNLAVTVTDRKGNLVGDLTADDFEIVEDGKKLAVVRDGVSLQQLVDGLNGLGIGPRDMISILQAIKAAGAIQADIEVM